MKKTKVALLLLSFILFMGPTSNAQLGRKIGFNLPKSSSYKKFNELSGYDAPKINSTTSKAKLTSKPVAQTAPAASTKAKAPNAKTPSTSNKRKDTIDRKDPPGRTYGGYPINRYGKKIGPNQNEFVHKVRHSQKKSAMQAAKLRSKSSKPVHHAHPQKGKRHFHPSKKSGKKIPCSAHHEYR